MSYTDYLEVDALCALQKPRSNPEEHDELLFIIIHQTYELWFKQLHHELDFLQSLWESGDVGRSAKVLKRLLKIMKTLVAQVDILETMTPLEFDSFRARLDNASGFQSYQFRALECRLGYKQPKKLSVYEAGSSGYQCLQEALQRASVWQAFLTLLKHNDFEIPESALTVTDQPTKPSPDVQTILMTVYREHPELAALCELLVDLDEGLQEWRYRHVKMVERTIGHKVGTGGSSGAAYLQQTLFRPIFPDLWDIRSQF